MLPPFSPKILLPYRRVEYESELTPAAIAQRLSENVITTFSLYSEKPYYGGFTPYSFSVRRVYSRLKKQSMAPTVEGVYRDFDGRVLVTIDLRPHLILIVGAAVLFFPMTMFLALSVGEFVRTWNVGVLISGFVPFVFIYALFWLIFQFQAGPDLRFWEAMLRLRVLQP